MGLLTDIQKTFKGNQLIFVIGIVVAAFALYQYSRGKGAVMSGLANQAPSQHTPDMNGSAAPAASGSFDSTAAPVSVGNGSAGAPSCSSRPTMNPGELLPQDSNSEWAQLNPRASGDFQNVNLLRAGYFQGIDTVGSSLRNANLQVRSEPPNPQNNVSIWNNSTITPDLMRIPLEIGQGGQ